MNVSCLLIAPRILHDREWKIEREMHIQALKCILYEYKLENNIYKKNNP